MTDLQHRQQKMQEKRKNTPRRKFLMDIVSLRSLSLYNHYGAPSIFPNTGRVKGVISHMDFEKGRDELVTSQDYTQQYETFFDQFGALWNSINMPPTILFGSCENADFTDQTLNCNNCYLSYVVIRDCENVLYSVSVKEGSSNVLNSLMVRDNCSNIFGSQGIIQSFNVFYSRFIRNSSNIWFSKNLVGCSECLMCQDLVNQSYCIQNKQHTKQEYTERKRKILAEKKLYNERATHIERKSGPVVGEGGHTNIDCVSITNAYMNYQVNEGRNIMLIGGKEPGERIYDGFLQTPSESDIYGVNSAGFGTHIYNAHQISGGAHIYYSYMLENCSYCLGCVGLKNKQFCILNKQYTKDTRHEKVNEIFSAMEQQGILGEFFPGRLNPFYFNDTAAYLLDDSFTKQEVEAAGYMRRDETLKVDIPEGVDVVKTQDLDNYEGRMIDGEFVNLTENVEEKGNRTIHPDVLKKVIVDETGNYYRIIPMEYKFLKKHGLPLPRKHWLERLKNNFTIGSHGE